MAIDKTFNKTRIKALLEYNMRKYRVRGIQYNNYDPGTNPDGSGNLVTDDTQLTSWKENQVLEIPTTPKKYSLGDNNINLLEALTDTIYDILGGTTIDTTGLSTSSLPTGYPTISNPSKGDKETESTGDLYFGVASGKTITLGSGTNKKLVIRNAIDFQSDIYPGATIDFTSTLFDYETHLITIHALTGNVTINLPYQNLNIGKCSIIIRPESSGTPRTVTFVTGGSTNIYSNFHASSTSSDYSFPNYLVFYIFDLISDGSRYYITVTEMES